MLTWLHSEYIRLTGESKLAVGMNASMNGYVFICVSPVLD